MRRIQRIVLFVFLIIGLNSMSLHRFYVAIYQVKFVPEKKMIQVTTRVFIDDLNEALENKFHKKTYLGTENVSSEDIQFLKKYFSDKFSLTINGQQKTINYLSYELESNVIICYFNIKDISKVNTMEVENKILIEVYPEQQNIIQFDINNKKQNVLLSSETTKGMLN